MELALTLQAYVVPAREGFDDGQSCQEIVQRETSRRRVLHFRQQHQTGGKQPRRCELLLANRAGPPVTVNVPALPISILPTFISVPLPVPPPPCKTTTRCSTLNRCSTVAPRSSQNARRVSGSGNCDTSHSSNSGGRGGWSCGHSYGRLVEYQSLGCASLNSSRPRASMDIVPFWNATPLINCPVSKS